ncbi:fungal-specific transcription factor domain-containing protein [Zalerion maritima]|uniref:Fungal-specific transcription factor domain-containing protein n=1 Tax=Zalerion maritima TaxID=339359 RepID=A0AAD5RZK6_9PEZI|nr:fungal-specific transcription factor domain-containing protein [Zalerion maritima]
MDISDLLVRHEKLVHLNDGNKESTRPRKGSSAAGASGSASGAGPGAGGGPPQVQPGGPSNAQVDPDMMVMTPTSQTQPQYHAIPSTVSLAADHHMPARSAACNLALLSDAATHLASATEVNQMPPGMEGLAQPSPMGRIKQPYDEMGYDNRVRAPDPPVIPQGYPSQGAPEPMDDYNLFLDDFASSSSHFLPPAFEADQSLQLLSRPATGNHNRSHSKPGSQFPSRFPSLQPDGRDPGDGSNRQQEDSARAPPFRISATDHVVIKNKLDEFSSVLPPDFVFPSRHTLTRFFEGYVAGFNENLPFLHIATMNPTEMAPELVLAMLSVGAQYRFESHRGHALWYAAKAVAQEQIRRRHSHEVHGLLPTPAAYSPHSTRPSPSTSYRHSFAAAQESRPITTETHRELYSSNTPQAKLETVQAILLLFAVGLWGAKAILQEAMSLQSQLAFLLREEGFATEPTTQMSDWEAWARVEGTNRTKLIAYCFFNLCSISYGTPPMLLTGEMSIILPSSQKLWRAESAWLWQVARHSYQGVDITLQDAIARLFCRPAQSLGGTMSSLANYVLIHALIQHIFLLKQTSYIPTGGFGVHRGIKLEDLEDVGQAIRAWQNGFEQRHQMRAAEAATGSQLHQSSGTGPEAALPGGPVAFNSTALLRLAYIRLYTDLHSARALETRDAAIVGQSLADAPLLARSLRLNRAVLQAIHALSMLVKLGVNYVARAKSLEWSIQHSLCNLECAILLSKWLQTLSALGPSDPPLAPEERSLLEMVRRMLDETEFAVPVDPSLTGAGGAGGSAAAGGMGPGSGAGGMGVGGAYGAAAGTGGFGETGGGEGDTAKMRQLAVAVLRLWSETFKGSPIFDIVRVIGAGLESFAEILEKPRDRTPLGRMTAPGLV